MLKIKNKLFNIIVILTTFLNDISNVAVKGFDFFRYSAGEKKNTKSHKSSQCDINVIIFAPLSFSQNN